MEKALKLIVSQRENASMLAHSLLENPHFLTIYRLSLLIQSTNKITMGL
ncbi:hypothetical protein [Coxiella endosymbiont of Ornithodoros maritimus]|nr:hypothetical protein [Coxiella endosymbiont of Ornithodoros maritimus]